MKKSKFLKSSKDLFSRSFNPSKCKTALKMAGSRVKILRNKKEVQVKQIKREIAHLLESGQDQTARIRVEHAVREEKMMAAYDLIEIYCELLVARMQIIESQKTCPSDLKEAIASLIFASPRCADVSELLDLKKHFTEKYGKDFITAALEIRPQCGVSRMLVEKLAPTPPDGQAKIKILRSIAEEHNVKWDGESFEENNSVPPSDLLNGTSSFEETKLQVELRRSGSLDVPNPQSTKKIYGSPLNSSQPDHRTPLRKENYGYAQDSGGNTAVQARPATIDDESHGNSISTPRNRRRWNMEFKDATSAAQAAAESAELASLAARAAAELSSQEKFMRQYSTESHEPEPNALSHGGPETFMNSRLSREQFSREPINRSYSEDTWFPNEQIDRVKPNNVKTDGRFNGNSCGEAEEFNQSRSLKSKTFSDDAPVVDRHSQKSSSGEVSRGELSMQRQSFKHKAEREDQFGEQPDVKYSQSRSSISEDVNIFANYEDQEFKSNSTKTYSRDSAAVVFDESDSDRGIQDFGMGPTYDEQEPGFDWSSSGQNVHEQHPVIPDSSGSSKGKHSSLFFTRKNSSDCSGDMKSVDNSRVDNLGPVKFDDSDGSASENDEGMDMSRHIGLLEESREIPSKRIPLHRPPFKEKGLSGFDRRQSQLSSDDELKYDEMNRQIDQEQMLGAYAPAKFGIGKPSFGQPGSEPRSSHVESNYIDNSSPEGLDFEKLTGGLRHKGYNHPLLNKHIDTSSSFNRGNKVAAALSTNSTAVESPWMSKSDKHLKGKTARDFHRESDSYSSEEEESFTPRAGKEVQRKPTLTASSSDSSDLDDDLPKESPPRRTHVRHGISHRTKVPSTTGSGNISYSRTRLSVDSPNFVDEMAERPTTTTSESPKTYGQPAPSKIASKPVTSNLWGPPELSSWMTEETKTWHRSQMHDPVVSVERKDTNSYPSETQQHYQSLRKNSSGLGNSEQQPTSAKAASKPTKSNLWGATDPHHSTAQSKKTRDSSAMEEMSSAHPKTQPAVSSECLKPAPTTLSKTSSNNNSSNQRANHVHPKLPDYDTLVQSLRKNRA